MLYKGTPGLVSCWKGLRWILHPQEAQKIMYRFYLRFIFIQISFCWLKQCGTAGKFNVLSLPWWQGINWQMLLLTKVHFSWWYLKFMEEQMWQVFLSKWNKLQHCHCKHFFTALVWLPDFFHYYCKSAPVELQIFPQKHFESTFFNVPKVDKNEYMKLWVSFLLTDSENWLC